MFRNQRKTYFIFMLFVWPIALIGCGSGVVQPPNILINPKIALLRLHETSQLHALAGYVSGSTVDVTSTAVWASRSAAIATVDAHGLLSCEAAGTTEVTANSRGESASVPVSCLVPQVAIGGMPSLGLVGQTVQLHAMASYADGSTADVTSTVVWASDAVAIATINAHGLLSCEADGTTQVTATSEGGSASVSANCVSPIASLSISPAKISTMVGSSNRISATAITANGDSIDVTSKGLWSADSNIVSLQSKGVLSCLSPGSANLSVYYSSTTQTIPVACVSPSLNTQSYFTEASDEFVGPFNSWTNIKTAYGAVGDGIADDTAPIQKALNDLNQPGVSPVIWFPVGVYKITNKLSITHKANFSIIGEDPSSTVLKWAGPINGTLLQTDGSTVFRIARFTFDGNGTADTAEDLTSVTPGGDYSTFNELSDQHIKGFDFGIRLGADAETTVERVFFDHLTSYGLVLESFNTLNIFINDSLFYGCGTGVSNIPGIGNLPGAGNFIVSNSYFAHSANADMSIGNTGYFTARHNTSVASRAFFTAGIIGNNPAPITLQNNTILDPIDPPIQLGNMGALMVIDNAIRMNNSASPAIVGYHSTSPGDSKDVFSFGNIYTTNVSHVTEGASSFQGRYEAFDDSIEAPFQIPDAVLPTNVYVPPNLHRAIFEVPAGSSGQDIQAAVDKAAASGSAKPVVHMPAGSYDIRQMISIPPGSDMQLIGDGPVSTTLYWNGRAQQSAIQLHTSNASLKYFDLNRGNEGQPTDGILLQIADQPSTQIIVDEAQLQGGNTYSVNFDGLEHATAELFSTYTSGSSSGISIAGGPFRVAREATVGVTNQYTGSLQSEGAGTSFNVSAGGKFMVQDNWHDGGMTSARNFALSGFGTVTEQTGFVGMNSDVPFEIDGFEGNVSLIGLQLLSGGFNIISGPNRTNLLTLGLVGNNSTYLPESTGNVTVSNMLDSYYDRSGGNHIAEQEIPDPQWLRTMLSQTRVEYPIQRLPIALGANRIRITRIAIRNAISALHAVPDQPSKGLYYDVSNEGAYLTRGNAESGCISSSANSSGTAESKWILLPAGDGDFQMAAVGVNEVLGAIRNSDGSYGLTMEAISKGYDQRWLIRNVGDGRFSFVNRLSGEMLSAASPSSCVQLVSSGTPDTRWALSGH